MTRENANTPIKYTKERLTLEEMQALAVGRRTGACGNCGSNLRDPATDEKGVRHWVCGHCGTRLAQAARPKTLPANPE